MKTSIVELQTMTDAEKQYRIWERIEEMHLSNMDYKAAMLDKWAMAANYGGNH